jgi:hypothetical protein
MLKYNNMELKLKICRELAGRVLLNHGSLKAYQSPHLAKEILFIHIWLLFLSVSHIIVIQEL